MDCYRSIGPIFVAVEHPIGGLAQAHRPIEHRVEHRREIAGRRIDDPQHLGGRGLSCFSASSRCAVRSISSRCASQAVLEIGDDLLRIG